MEEIFTFLGLGNHPEVDAFLRAEADKRTPVSAPMGRPGSVGREAWEGRLDDSQVSKIEVELSGLMSEFGYVRRVRRLGRFRQGEEERAIRQVPGLDGEDEVVTRLVQHLVKRLRCRPEGPRISPRREQTSPFVIERPLNPSSSTSSLNGCVESPLARWVSMIIGAPAPGQEIDLVRHGQVIEEPETGHHIEACRRSNSRTSDSTQVTPASGHIAFGACVHRGDLPACLGGHHRELAVAGSQVDQTSGREEREQTGEDLDSVEPTLSTCISMWRHRQSRRDPSEDQSYARLPVGGEDLARSPTSGHRFERPCLGRIIAVPRRLKSRPSTCRGRPSEFPCRASVLGSAPAITSRTS